MKGNDTVKKSASRLISIFASFAVLCTTSSPTVYAESATDYLNLIDSGISYDETVETINNPGAGYTSSVWAYCSPGKTSIYSPTGKLVVFFIDIGGFSCGANGVTADDGTYTEGTDYDFDDVFFDSWRQTFANCRKNGCMIALRWRYDSNGKTNPEPASFEQVLRHVQQIKESGILEEYKDIIAYVESGFVGCWGEQHGGKYTSVEHKAQLLDAMLDCVPSPIPVTVRTPDTFAKWCGIERSALADYYPEEGSDAARVGLYDDGYMGSNSDLGTYANREIETEWLSHQTLTSYFGGEFSGNLEFAQQYDTYLPENCIPEMYKTHLSYINSNIWGLYDEFTFGEEYDVEGVDNSAYYGQTVKKFIRDHLGYRFVLRKSELSDSVVRGGQLSLHFKVENTGFANPIPKQKAEILLERDGQFIRTEVDINSNEWYSCTTADEVINVKLPDSLPSGKWNAYLKLSVGSNTVEQVGLRSIRFANENVWNGGIGANYLGSFTVFAGSAEGTDNGFYQIDDNISENPVSHVYTVNGHINPDGEVSFPQEWTDDMLIAENGDTKLYMTADDKYFYFMGKVPGEVKSPVYNLRIMNSETERSYWTYFMSNGYVYFNNGSHDGILCRWSDDTVEFRIEFGDTMASQPDTKFDSVRLFVQDSSLEWIVTDDVTAENVTVPSDFNVFSAIQQIRLEEDDSYPVTVHTDLDNASYQWLRNGEEINGAQSKDYIINAEDGAALYSVIVTTASGIEKTVDICKVLGIKPDSTTSSTKTTGALVVSMWGDANYDSQVNLADAVLIMQHNSNPTKYTMDKRGALNADVSDNGDGITNKDALRIQQFLLGIVKTLKPV